MPFFALIAKLALKIISVLGIVKFLHWYFGGDSTDALPNDGSGLWEKTGWIRKIAFFLLAAYTFIALAAFGFDNLSKSSQATVTQFGKAILDIVKWPLIIITLFSVNWLIWDLYLSRALGKYRTPIDHLFINYPTAHLIMGGRNKIWLLVKIAMVNTLLLWAIYHQLPESIQHDISAIFSTHQLTTP
jgi:hypothetical protein